MRLHLTLAIFLAVTESAFTQSLTRPLAAPPAKTTGSTARPQAPAALASEGTNALITSGPEIDDLATGALGILDPSITYSIQYGNAIPSAPGLRQKSTTHQVSPSVRVRLAEQWSLSYRPTFSWYSNEAFTDQVSHSATLKGTGMIRETDVGLSQTYSRSNDVLVETAQQTKQETWSTNGSIGHSLTERTRLVGSGNLQLRYTEAFTDSEAVQASVGLTHRFAEQLDLGVSAGAGYTTMNPGVDYTIQTLGLNVQWKPGTRLTIDSSIGFQITRFRVTNSSNRSSPTYNVSANYQIFEFTTLSLAANRSASASYFSSQLNDRSRVSISVNQRVLEKLSLSLSASSDKSDYLSSPTTFGSTFGRVDRGHSYQASLATTLVEKLSLSLTWQYNRYRSNRVGYTYNSSMIGASAGWHF